MKLDIQLFASELRYKITLDSGVVPGTLYEYLFNTSTYEKIKLTTSKLILIDSNAEETQYSIELNNYGKVVSNFTTSNNKTLELNTEYNLSDIFPVDMSVETTEYTITANWVIDPEILAKGKALVSVKYLEDIANAIRDKNGETTEYRPGEMKNAISSLPYCEYGTFTVTQENVDDRKIHIPTKRFDWDVFFVYADPADYLANPDTSILTGFLQVASTDDYYTGKNFWASSSSANYMFSNGNNGKAVYLSTSRKECYIATPATNYDFVLGTKYHWVAIKYE